MINGKVGKIDFYVKFEKINTVTHHFYDGEYSPYDDLVECPSHIYGEILIDNKSIGSIRIPVKGFMEIMII